MPNRTIYVADADMPIFEKAQRLAGDNLSATIVQALRRFVETEEAKVSGFEEITVSVGKGRPYLRKQFRGRIIARRRLSVQDDTRWLVLTVYQTAKGRFALYTRYTANWSGWSNRQRKASKSKRAYEEGSQWDWEWNWDISSHDWSSAYEDERRLEVFETLEELKEQIPEELYEAIAQYLKGGDLEILDI
ncbi:MAG TPA: EXLDI protein [Ktedonobacteraceae bacterium]|jgi:EXLDI family protein|nr:EXLDI protein [Ktedonobacteraceae bacterium]